MSEDMTRDSSGRAWLVRPQDERRIIVCGPDARAYVHRMVSNDVEALAVGAGCHALYLKPQGHITADLVILRTGEDALEVLVPEAAFATVLKRWTMFLLNDDAEVLAGAVEGAEDSSAALNDEPRVLLTLQGAGAAGVLAAAELPTPAEPYGHEVASFLDVELRILRRARLAASTPGFDLIVPAEGASAVASALEANGAERVEPERLELERIRGLMPRFGPDLNDTVLPQEAWLERDAISFEKGCYPGQETVAKIKYRGRVNRRLVGLELDQDAAPETELQREGKRVGRLTSVATDDTGERIGLGYLKRDRKKRA